MRLDRPILAIVPLVAVLLAGMFPAVSAAAPKARWVDDDGRAGPTACAGTKSVPTSIQSAVDVSGPGDTIRVCPGTYVGQVDVSTPNLTIVGVRPWKATVLPRADHPSNHPLILIHDTSGVTLQWLDIRARATGTCQQVGGMITITESPRTTIRANRIGARGASTLGACGYESGVRLISDSDDSVIAFNLVRDFKLAGIEARETNGSVSITRNSVRYFHAGYASLGYTEAVGIIVQDAPGAAVRDNRVRNLPGAGATSPVSDGILRHGAPARIIDNTVWYTATGIALVATTGGTLRDNQVRGSTVQGILLSFAHDARVRGNRVSGAGWGIVLHSTTSGNRIQDNDALGNADLDCIDNSSGPFGTFGTDNFWTDNLGDDSTPSGICGTPV